MNYLSLCLCVCTLSAALFSFNRKLSVLISLEQSANNKQMNGMTHMQMFSLYIIFFFSAIRFEARRVSRTILLHKYLDVNLLMPPYLQRENFLIQYSSSSSTNVDETHCRSLDTLCMSYSYNIYYVDCFNGFFSSYFNLFLFLTLSLNCKAIFVWNLSQFQ